MSFSLLSSSYRSSSQHTSRKWMNLAVNVMVIASFLLPQSSSSWIQLRFMTCASWFILKVLILSTRTAQMVLICFDAASFAALRDLSESFSSTIATIMYIAFKYDPYVAAINFSVQLSRLLEILAHKLFSTTYTMPSISTSSNTSSSFMLFETE